MNKLIQKNLVAFIFGLATIAIAAASSAVIKVNVLEERTNNFANNFEKIEKQLEKMEQKIDNIKADYRH